MHQHEVRGEINKNGSFGWFPPQNGLAPTRQVLVELPLFCGKNNSSDLKVKFSRVGPVDPISLIFKVGPQVF